MPLHAYETTTPSRQYQSSPILVSILKLKCFECRNNKGKRKSHNLGSFAGLKYFTALLYPAAPFLVAYWPTFAP